MHSPGRGATGLRVGRRVRVGIVHQMRLGRGEGVGVVWQRLRRRWEGVSGHDVAVGVDDLHGVLLVSGRFVVRFKVLVLLVVEAPTRFNRAPPARVRPAGWGVVNMTGRAVVGHRKTSGEGALGRRRLRGKVAGGGSWRTGLWSGGRWHGLTDDGGVGDMWAGGRGGLRQLATASTWSAGP